MWRLLHIAEHKVRVLQNVHPEAQWKANREEQQREISQSHYILSKSVIFARLICSLIVHVLLPAGGTVVLRTCLSSRYGEHLDLRSFFCLLVHPGSRRNIWQPVELCCWAIPRYSWKGTPQKNGPLPGGHVMHILNKFQNVILKFASVYKKRESVTLVDSSFVRYTSLNLTSFFSGFLLWSLSMSGS